MFLIIYVICFSLLMVEKENYEGIVEEKKKVEEALLKALEDTARELSKVVYDSDEKRRQLIETVFMDSLYVSLGIFDKKEEQEKFRMYLPMLVLAEEDGAQFYYIKEVNQNEVTELKHVWSEKIDFDIKEEQEEAKKKVIVAEILEKRASEIITNYNYIAAQYGLEYSFYVPKFLQNMEEALEFPMLFVVFQGWPLSLAGDVVYENCLDAGGYLQEVLQYVVELPVSLDETLCYYHEMDCPDILEEDGYFLEEYMTEKDAITIYGAIPCSICIE